MSTEYIWSEVKDKARQADSRSDDEREAGQVLAVERREASIRGHRLAEMRKASHLMQAVVDLIVLGSGAERIGLSADSFRPSSTLPRLPIVH